MIDLPKRGGGVFTVTDEQFDLWRSLYPGIDVAGELRKMSAWLDGNPEKRKVRVKAFVVNWLNRAKPAPRASEHYAIVAERLRPPPEPMRPYDSSIAVAALEQVKRELGMRR